jgi:hypothetical protein
MSDYYAHDWQGAGKFVLGFLAVVVVGAVLFFGGRSVSPSADSADSADSAEASAAASDAAPFGAGGPAEDAAEDPADADLAALFTGGHEDLAAAGATAVDFAAEAATLAEGETPSDYHDRLAEYTSFDLTTELPDDPTVEALYEDLSAEGGDPVGSARIYQLRVTGVDEIELSLETEAAWDGDPVPFGVVDVTLVPAQDGWDVASLSRFTH